MRRIFIAFSFLIGSLTAQSQAGINWNNITGTTDTTTLDLIPGHLSFTKSNLSPITSSTHYIEIRLYTWAMLGGNCFVLSYDNKDWSLKFYTSDFWGGSRYELKNNLSAALIFDRLLSNAVFDLRTLDYAKFGIYNMPDDCDENLLVYKVGNKYRSYEFYCPEFLSDKYAGEKTLQKYVNLNKIFLNTVELSNPGK